MQILSFDIGGTKIAYALVDENGRVLTNVQTVPTPKSADEIIRIFKKTTMKYTYERAALATAGVVFNGKLQGKPNNLPSGYENLEFGDILKTPFLIENDANAALWAEYKIGSLRGVQNGIMLTLGTDTGCGIICDGRILRGKCGATGEVSFPFSGRDLKRFGAQYNVAESDCFKIYELARQGYESARKAYYAWEENLISGLKLLNGLLDTEVFVLSGSLSKIVDYAKVSTALSLLQPRNPAMVKPALCGTNAGLIGAALLCAESTVHKDF
ncbi:MAG: ROK family protein [Alphaproteobacteria bacterium]|nr:ROK family protein [Alphaproteobacteria bacterium]